MSNVRILSQAVDDDKTRIAIRQLEQVVQSALVRISDLEVNGGGGGSDVTLPIGMSDVTGLAAALAAKASAADLALKADKARTITAGTGLTGGGDLSADRTIALADTAVTPGSYTSANITVDQQGRITVASSGSTPTPSIWDTPASPSADDDEFESTTLNAAWLTTDTLSTGVDPYAGFASGDLKYDLHTNRRASWLMLQPPADAARHGIYKPITLGTNGFVWMRFSTNGRINGSPVNNDYSIGLALSATAGLSGDAVELFAVETDAGIVQAEFLKRVSGVTTSIATSVDKFVSQLDVLGYEAVGIQKLGTTYHAWLFTSNGSALYMGNTTFSGTIGYVALITYNGATTTPGNMIVGVDFVRRVDSAVFLP